MRNLNYNHLYYFWTVARNGSVTKAADILALTPQTISGQIRALENSIGKKLFEKAGRKLILTRFGQTLFEYCDDIFKLGNELIDIVKGNTRESNFRVGLSEHIQKSIVYSLLEPALHLSPRINLSCIENSQENLISDLRLHKLDLILSNVTLPPEPETRIYHHELGKSGMTFFASLPLISKFSAPFPELLDKAPFLLPTADSPLRHSLELWFENQGLTPQIVGEFSDGALLTSFGQAGAGIFVSPTAIRDEIIRQYNVEALGEINSVTETYYAITADKQLKQAAAKAIIEKAQENIFNN